MTSFPSRTSQPYNPPNHNYPSYSPQGSYSYTRPDLGSPSSFKPYPSLPISSYPGSSNGYTTPFPTSGLSQPTFSSHPTLSGPSFGNSSSPSFRPPSFDSRIQQERTDRFNPSMGTPSWVNSASLPSHLSSSYTRTNHNAGFSPAPLQPLDTSFLRYPTSMGSTPSISSSLGISSFTPQPPSLSGRAYVASSFSLQGTLPSNSWGISFPQQPPSLSGRVHFANSSSQSQGTLPSRSYEITTWTPQSFSTERSPFIPSTFGKTSGSSSFSQYQPLFSSFEKHIDLQRMLRLQFEEAIKTMYQVRPSPERPFPIWQTMGTTPFAIQIDPRTTVFVDPVTVTKFFQMASSDQQRAFRAQFDQLTSRREAFDPSKRQISTMQQVNTFVADGGSIEQSTVPVKRSLGNSVMKTIALLNPAPQVFQSPENYSRALTVGSIDYPKVGIGFINGIDNTLDESIYTAQKISEYAQNAKVHLVYNASHGPLVDVMECAIGHLRVKTPPVELLKKTWSDFIATHGPNEKFLQICHSGGTIHVINALKTSPKEVQQRIIVAGYAPAAIVPEELCFKSFNYVSKRDFVTYLDILGYKRHSNELVRLDPHPDAPFWDHFADSPTFVETNMERIEAYMKGEEQ